MQPKEILQLNKKKDRKGKALPLPFCKFEPSGFCKKNLHTQRGTSTRQANLIFYRAEVVFFFQKACNPSGASL